jgi:hypothetical protein
MSGNVEGAWEASTEGLDIARRTNDLSAVESHFTILTSLAAVGGDVTLARSLGVEALEILRGHVSAATLCRLYNVIAWNSVLLDDSAVAYEHVQEALRRLSSVEDQGFAAMLLHTAAEAARITGRTAEARSFYIQSAEKAIDGLDEMTAALCLLGLADITARDDPALAAQLCASARPHVPLASMDATNRDHCAGQFARVEEAAGEGVSPVPLREALDRFVGAIVH